LQYAGGAQPLLDGHSREGGGRRRLQTYWEEEVLDIAQNKRRDEIAYTNSLVCIIAEKSQKQEIGAKMKTRILINLTKEKE